MLIRIYGWPWTASKPGNPGYPGWLGAEPQITEAVKAAAVGGKMHKQTRKNVGRQQRAAKQQQQQQQLVDSNNNKRYNNNKNLP